LDNTFSYLYMLLMYVCTYFFSLLCLVQLIVWSFKAQPGNLAMYLRFCCMWPCMRKNWNPFCWLTLYEYLLVAITLLCFSCKSYVATVRHRRVIWHWIFSISQIYKCAHMVNFCWPGHMFYATYTLYNQSFFIKIVDIM